MENKIVFQKEDNNNIMQKEDISLLKNNSIEGNGSESQLESINSTKKEITHSTISSVNPICASDNSINNSNDSNKMPINDQNSSFNKEKKAQINNGKHEELIGSKLSSIQNLELSYSKNEISALFNSLNKNSKDSEKKIDNVLDSIISHNNDKNENINDNDDKNKNINNDNNEDSIKKDLININKENKNEDLAFREELKIEVMKKIKEGYFPFFIKIEGYKAFFYYALPNSQIKAITEDYIHEMKIPSENKYSFYNEDKLCEDVTTVAFFMPEQVGSLWKYFPSTVE